VITRPTALLDPDSTNRLVKLLGMLGSAYDGERASAAAKVDALVRSLGLTWRDLITPPLRIPPTTTDWQRMAAFCHTRHAQLSPREREFIRSMLAWRGEPTDKQSKWLIDLYVRLQSGNSR
jgi:hypothetical protein